MGDAAALTPKEAEVLGLVRERLTNAEIAQRLVVSERTVESHVAAVLRKMQAPNRRALANPAPPQPTGNLPARLTSFVGRVAEVAQLERLLATSRIVTLTGPAGSGKTRLAIEAAARAPRYPDGVWFVDLASVTSEHGVAEKVLVVLGGRQSPGRSAEDTLTGMVRGRSALLILDNCEHLVAACAWVAGVLAAASADARIVVTSRVPLEVPGEVVFTVPPLATPTQEADPSENDAVRLLLDRARDAGASVDLGTDAEPVSRICRRLDGLPLALELIAPRLRAFTPRHLVELLDHRFELVASSGAGRPARHHTLRDAIEWSYDLLDADERALFTRLSVFAGSFRLEAAAAVCADSKLPRSRVLETFPRLLDRSLVVVQAGPEAHRYRLLESLRAFAAERLDREAAAALQARHATHYLDLAEAAQPRLHSAEGVAVRDQLRHEHDELLHALEWATHNAPDAAVRFVAALAEFWTLADAVCTGIDWAERVLPQNAGTARDRVRALVGATALTSAADHDAARRYGGAALTLARDLADPELVARAEASLLEACAYEGDTDAGADLAARAMGYFAQVDDRWAIAQVQASLSFLRDAGDALPLLDAALEAFTRLGDRLHVANVHYVLADRYLRELGDIERARPHAEQALAIAQEIGSRHEETHAMSILAEIDLHAGDAEPAEMRAKACLDEFERLGDHRCVTAMTFLVARCAAARGADAQCLQLITDVLRYSERAAHGRTVPLALDLAARLLAERRPALAFACATAADARAGRFGLGPRPDRIDPGALRDEAADAAVPDELEGIAALLARV